MFECWPIEPDKRVKTKKKFVDEILNCYHNREHERDLVEALNFSHKDCTILIKNYARDGQSLTDIVEHREYGVLALKKFKCNNFDEGYNIGQQLRRSSDEKFEANISIHIHIY